MDNQVGVYDAEVGLHHPASPHAEKSGRVERMEQFLDFGATLHQDRDIEQLLNLIEQLLDIGAALSAQHDLDELLNLILTKSREITCSDAGSVYLVERQEGAARLLFKIAQNDSHPNMQLHEFAIPLDERSLAGYVAATGRSLNIPDAYEIPDSVPYKLNASFDESLPYRTKSVLVLPMQNRQGETVGVIQVINRKVSGRSPITPENVGETVQPYSEWEERVLRSLASQAAISIDRRNLEASIEHLFEGFVLASVQAIEARDPCTSGHSERVAALTVRLAEEATAVHYGVLRHVAFSDRQIQEIRYAALLHDFGKVGVPEAILTKRKKLYPYQLEFIRYRLSLAQRTLEAECAQAKYRHLIEHPQHIANHNDPTCPHCQAVQHLEAEMQAGIQQLERHWELLQKANEPHILAKDPMEQLRELAKHTYRDVDGQLKPLITPEEMEQLCIQQGTLTAEERRAIESHVTHTYEFLRRIPWTKDLEKVPTIAYGHHEKLNGGGYPLGLIQGDIPIQTQMMTIADIYDALTAGDRPYKRALPISKALHILHQEVAAGKINADLLSLFQHRRVYTVLGHEDPSE